MKAVEALGYNEPTPIQEQSIPYALEGRDIIAAAKTGTGKTAAFALPGMARIQKTKAKRRPSMVVVTPTRELAQQISETCEVIAKFTHLRVLTVVGGLSYDPQIKALNRGCDVLIATPGRLIDLMHQEAVELDDVEIIVLDEADRMLDMGFWPQVKEIVDATAEERQTLLFSATIDPKVDTNSQSVLRDPVLVEIARKGETADTVDQYIIHTNRRERPDLLNNLLAQKGAERVIVFTRTKGCADSCTRRLNRAGFKAEAIHADRSQAQRRKALDLFRAGKVGILVATDVLARGIDVPEVDYVVNYDLPDQIEDYVHRIGRTGRAGKGGFAVSFIMPDMKRVLKEIQKFIGKKLPEMQLEPPVAAILDTEDNDPEIAAVKAELAKAEKKEKSAEAHAGQKTQVSKSTQKSQRSSQRASQDTNAHGKSKNASAHKKRSQARKKTQNTSGAVSKAQNSSQSKPQGNAQGKSHNKPQGKTHGKPQRTTQHKAHSKPQGKPQGKNQKPRSASGAPKRDVRPGRSVRAQRKSH